MPAAPPPESSNTPLAVSRVVRELASGVDTFNFTANAEVPEDLFAELEALQVKATTEQMPQPFKVNGAEFMVQGSGWRQHTYLLTHPYGRVGITASDQFPAFRVQPLAVALHGLGAAETIAWFEAVVEALAPEPQFTASRIDLFCDVQGFVPVPEDRHLMVCRSRNVISYEIGGELTGLVFGKRKTAGAMLRLYDKTRQVWDQGLDYWYPIWGDRFDPALPVWRVEFEVGRKALRQFGINTTADAFPRLAGMWANITSDLYRHCIPTGDDTRSRWPISPAWNTIQQASLRADAVPIERLREAKRQGTLRKLQGPFTGVMSSFIAYSGCRSLDEALDLVPDYLEEYEDWSMRLLMDRVEEKRRR